jgi:predicted phosphodiesterase
MIIGLLSDPHYSSATITCGKRYNSLSFEKLRMAFDHFAETGCELVILLGDITDTEPTHEIEADNLRKLSSLMDNYPFRIICLMGNHDSFVFSSDEFYSLIGQSHRPRPITIGNTSLYFIDACYFSDGRHYAPGDSNWKDTFYPHTTALSTDLKTLNGDIWVFMHQNIDPDIPCDHRLSNASELCHIFEENGNVRIVFQGHYHPGNISTHSGIEFITLPAMCENDVMHCIRKHQVH